jgi:hypothetical protein
LCTQESANLITFSSIRTLAPKDRGVPLILIPKTEPTRQELSMTLSKFRPHSIAPNRCSHETPGGRRCRLKAANSASGLCHRHATNPSSSPASDDLSSSFPAGLDEFMSAVQINSFLAQLALLLVQDRISPRRAAVLAYIQSLLLRTLPAVQIELDPEPDEPERRILFNLPRPDDSSSDSLASALSLSPSNDLNAAYIPDTTPRNTQTETLTPGPGSYL